MKRAFSIAALAAAVTLACADLGALLTLQQDLTTEFKAPAISVKIHNASHLSVVFTNSDAAQLPDSQRAAFARHVAEFVRDHYQKYATLEDVSIGFSEVRGTAGFRYTKTVMPYRFVTVALGSPLDTLQTSTQE